MVLLLPALHFQCRQHVHYTCSLRPLRCRLAAVAATLDVSGGLECRRRSQASAAAADQCDAAAARPRSVDRTMAASSLRSGACAGCRVARSWAAAAAAISAATARPRPTPLSAPRCRSACGCCEPAAASASLRPLALVAIKADWLFSPRVFIERTTEHMVLYSLQSQESMVL